MVMSQPSAMDHRHAHHGEFAGERVPGFLDGAAGIALGRTFGLRLRRLVAAGEVGAGAEATAGAGEDEGAAGFVGLGFQQLLHQHHVGGAIERVEPVGPVDLHHAVALVDFHQNGFGHARFPCVWENLTSSAEQHQHHAGHHQQQALDIRALQLLVQVEAAE